MDDIPLELDRRGFLEETHFTIAYSPVPDETVASRIGRVLATVHEITDKVIGERRVHALHDPGARSMVIRRYGSSSGVQPGSRNSSRFPKEVCFGYEPAACRRAYRSGTL